MKDVTIRQRNQVTIPMDIARRAGLSEGTVCHVEYVGGVITLTPAGQSPAPALADFAGCARGAWGATASEGTATIASDRDSWDR